LEGRLRPGETLPISDLVVDLGVSHSPVREALQRLSAQGLVVLRQARTAMIAPLDRNDLQEIYRLRRLIELDAAARAAPLLSDQDIARLGEEFNFLAEAVIDSEDFWDHHNAFHSALMAPVLTPRLQRVITELWDAAGRYVRVVYGETDALFTKSPAARHQALLSAAQSRQSAVVKKALSEHLRSNELEILASLKSIPTGGDR